MDIWVATNGTEGEAGYVTGVFYTIEQARETLATVLNRAIRPLETIVVGIREVQDGCVYLTHRNDPFWTLERFTLCPKSN